VVEDCSSMFHLVALFFWKLPWLPSSRSSHAPSLGESNTLSNTLTSSMGGLARCLIRLLTQLEDPTSLTHTSHLSPILSFCSIPCFYFLSLSSPTLPRSLCACESVLISINPVGEIPCQSRTLTIVVCHHCPT
jgi:hypothetical protein